MKSPLERFRECLTGKAYQRRLSEGRASATCNFEAFSIVRWDFISIFFSRFCFWYFPCRKGASGRVLRNGWLFILGYL